MKKFEHIVKVCILIFSMLSVNLTAWGNETTYKDSQLNTNPAGTWGLLHGSITISGGSYASGTKDWKLCSLNKSNTKTFDVTWKSNEGTSISISKITFAMVGYGTGSQIKAKFNNNSYTNIGNLVEETSDVSISNPSSGLTLTVFCSANIARDIRIKSITVEYTITPDAPTIKKSTETINVSLTNENILDMTNLIGVSDVADFMPVAFESNSYSDPQGVSSTGAYTFTGTYFYATKAGVYTFTNPYIAAKKDCHKKSATTTGKVTITVNRLNQILTMGNGQVNATTDKSNPTKLDLSTLCTQVGNGTVKYELVSAPNALDGTSAVNSCVINGKYFHAWVAGTYTLKASAPMTAQYNAATPQEFKVTVDHVANSLAFYENKNVDVRYVEQTVNGAVSTNSNATINTSTTDGSLAYYDAAQNKIYIPNSNNQSFDAKEVTLKVWQDETDVYTASAVKTLTLTVLKYDNNISISGFDNKAHEIKTDWYDNELTLIASNTDYTHFPIYNERTQGDDTQASFGRQEEGTTDKWVVYTGQNTGVVEWRLWQDENYKYKAGETTFMVNVINNPNCTCNLVDMSWKKDHPTVSTVGNKGYIGFGGIGETLSFELDRNLAAGNAARYRLWTNDSWSGYESAMDSSVIGGYTQIGPIALGTGKNNTTAVEFAKGSNWITGLNTDDPYINNIKVTRKRWMKILDGAGKSAKEITSLPKMERYIDGDTVHVTFYVDFSTCDSLVKVASNYGHVTFKNNLVRDTISENTAPVTTKGYNDKVRVDLYYYSDQVEEQEVTITIYTEFENKTLTVPVKTVGYIFKGGASDAWTEPKNWNVGKVPNANHDVIIESNAVVNDEMAVHSMDITTGSVTIAPEGGLTIGAGGVKGANKDNLILQAGKEGETKGQTGYLRISPEFKGTMPEATVELFSIGYYDKSSEEENIAAWQYVGAPIQMTALAKTVFTRSWIYSYVESEDKWVNNRAKLVMEPFVGYSTTQYDSKDGKLLVYGGTLVQNSENHISKLVYTDKNHGHNMLANSYAAPIDVTKMRTTDFVNAEPTIYLFNTGSRSQAHARAGTKGNMAGQFIPITIGSLKAMEEEFEDESVPTTIAPMQGFSVNATSPGATVTFDYERLVWNANYSKHQNRPLYAPAGSVKTSENAAQEDDVVIRGALMLKIEADGWSDNCYLLESDSYERAFEMGFDASKMFGGNLNIFTLSDTMQLAINATNSIVGTRIGVRAGEATAYTMSFSHLRSEHELLFFDSETNEVIDIYEGLEYTFNVEPNTTINDRFMLLEREKAPEVTTAIDKAEASSVKVKKFIKDNQLYILKNGVLYNAVGARVH